MNLSMIAIIKEIAMCEKKKKGTKEINIIIFCNKIK
jgi:hypothetical protein